MRKPITIRHMVTKIIPIQMLVDMVIAAGFMGLITVGFESIYGASIQEGE